MGVLHLRRAPAIFFLWTLLVSGPALAQDPGPAQSAPDSTEALFAEYQQVQERLGLLQVQTIQQNVELEARRTAIDEMLMAAMIDINPEAEAHIERLDVLSEEAIVAQRAQDTEALQKVYAEIDQLEKTQTEGRLYTEYRELFQYLMLPGLACILLEVFLGTSRFRSLP